MKTKKITRKAVYISLILAVVISVMNLSFYHPTKTKAEESCEWLQLYSSAKYCVTEVNHVIYCYFTEDCSGYGWIIEALGVSPQIPDDKEPLLPCENRDFMRIAGTKTEREQYHAGELVAVGINLETVQDQEEIRVADSLMYEGESIPVTKVELEQFAYAFSTDAYQYPCFHVLSDSISLYIGKNVTDIKLGDTVSVINAYYVDENNTSFCSADGILYRIDEEGNSSLLNIPDRYARTSMALPETCVSVDSSELISGYKYDALYPAEYSMGYLASEYFVKNYIHHRTFSWKENVTLENYLNRTESVYIPIEIKDPDDTHASVLVLYGDTESHRMYDEIKSNEDIFIENAFYRKGYKPSNISVDRMSYRDLVSYDTIEQYDFIFIEDDTYDYFGETQYQILYDASFNKAYITYAKNLETLEYADLEQNIIHESVKEIILPDSLEPDVAAGLIMHQKEIFPNLTAMQGAGTAAFYQMNEEDVIYAEDGEAVYYVGVTTNNTHTDFHLDTEKDMYVMPFAFKNIESANIYIHAPVLYLGQECFVDYSLGADDVESRQEIYVTYDVSVYKSYRYVGVQAEFPTVGTEEEVYEYIAEYEPADDVPSTEEAATEAESTEVASTETEGSTAAEGGEDTKKEEIHAENSVPLSGGMLSMHPVYYQNKGNIGHIIRYNKKGKRMRTITLDDTDFSVNDECNADYLVKKITTLKNTNGKLFLLAADSKYDKKKADKYKYQVIETGMDVETLCRVISLMNCKYFQYLGLVQSYDDEGKDIYIHEEKDLFVFHKWDPKKRQYNMQNIQFNLAVSDWEAIAKAGVFTDEAYGIQLDKFMEYYEICSEIDRAIDKIIHMYDIKNAKSERNVLDKINSYVRNRMSYDQYCEIAGVSWSLKKTSDTRNRNPDPAKMDNPYHKTDYHGMCGAYSRVAFVIAAKCGIDAIPCAVYKDAESVKAGPTHSITKVVLNGKELYCDFCWSSGGWKGEKENKYMCMTIEDMAQYEHHYKPTPDDMGTKITIKKSKASSEVKITFNSNGGSISFGSMMTQGGGKLMDFPDTQRKGYILKGWYTKRSGGNKIKIGQKLSKATTLYAHWEKVSVKKGKITQGKAKQKGKCEIIYAKIENVDGYQIQCSTSKKFAGNQTKNIYIKDNAHTCYTFENLRSDREYYFRIRAYRKDSTGATIHGKWSEVKKIKIV